MPKSCLQSSEKGNVLLPKHCTCGDLWHSVRSGFICLTGTVVSSHWEVYHTCQQAERAWDAGLGWQNAFLLHEAGGLGNYRAGCWEYYLIAEWGLCPCLKDRLWRTHLIEGLVSAPLVGGEAEPDLEALALGAHGVVPWGLHLLLKKLLDQAAGCCLCAKAQPR